MPTCWLVPQPALLNMFSCTQALPVIETRAQALSHPGKQL